MILPWWLQNRTSFVYQLFIVVCCCCCWLVADDGQSGSGGSAEERKKRPRTAFSATQIKALEAEFEKNKKDSRNFNLF